MNEAITYFQGGELTGEKLPNGEKRTPDRPLGVLSNFVVKELPECLGQIKSGAISKDLARNSMESLAVGCVRPKVGTHEYALGRLDVMMVYTGLAHRGVRVGEKFSQLIAYFSQADLAALTYEDVIMHNPAIDPRTFTHGEAGSDEASFYKLHYDLEKPMEPLVEAVKVFVENGPSSSTIQIEHNMQALGILFANTRSSGKGMRHFNDFRDYLNGIPKNMIAPTLDQVEYGGPSGAFSPTVHELDVLVCGIQGDDELARYVQANREYFPSGNRDVLDQAIAMANQGKSIMDYVRASGYDVHLVTLARSLLQPLANFRSAHLGAVEKQVPKLFKDETAAGTGGIASSVPFLRHRMEKIKGLLAELDEHSEKRERRTHAK